MSPFLILRSSSHFRIVVNFYSFALVDLLWWAVCPPGKGLLARAVTGLCFGTL